MNIILSRKILITFVIILSGFTTGCSVFNDPNAVKYHSNGNTDAMLMQADRRAVYMFGDKAGMVCSESAPDVKADLKSTLDTLTEISAKMPKVDATLKNQIQATRDLITSSIYERTNGVQIMRELVTATCFARIRGDIDSRTYANFLTQKAPAIAQSLVFAELVTKAEAEGKLDAQTVDAISNSMLKILTFNNP